MVVGLQVGRGSIDRQLWKGGGEVTGWLLPPPSYCYVFLPPPPHPSSQYNGSQYRTTAGWDSSRLSNTAILRAVLQSYKRIFMVHCNKNPIYVFPEKELRGHSPYSHIHVKRFIFPQDGSAYFPVAE
jgi:hypothetical protein